MTCHELQLKRKKKLFGTLYPLAQMIFYFSSGMKCQVFSLLETLLCQFYLEANAGKRGNNLFSK